MGTSRRILSQRFIGRAALIAAATTSMTGCRVDEITFGVGNARTEDAFGNPVVQPYQEEDSLRLYRIEIERDKPEDAEESSPPDSGGDGPDH